MRLDPATYVQLRRRDPSLHPIAEEISGGHAQSCSAIFTANPAIHTLEDLKVGRRSFAFGRQGSALEDYLPQASLAASGIHARDFQRCSNFPSGDAVIASVRKGEWDAGAADANQALLYTNVPRGLRLLTNVPGPGYIWVATRKLDPTVLPVVRARLLALRDPVALASVDSNLTRLRESRPGDYDALERQMEIAREFDNTRPDPDPTPSR